MSSQAANQFPDKVSQDISYFSSPNFHLHPITTIGGQTFTLFLSRSTRKEQLCKRSLPM